GTSVGIRPGSQGTAGAAAGTGSNAGGLGSSFDPGPDFDSDFDSLPTGPSGVGGDPAAPPTGPVATPPQCSAGILDQLLALIAEVLGGTEPAVALAASGALTPEPQSAEALLPGALGVYTLLPMGDRLVPVAGLVPLLDAIDQRQDARRLENPGLLAPQPAAPQPAAPVDQVTQLATLLAPLGLAVDPTSGTADPLLAPVLGSLGCPGFAAAPLQAAPVQEAPVQETIR
ncbi:MAG: hypothetical protein ACRDTC_16985, partial [Pseudonocardiaceae bacterium]